MNERARLCVKPLGSQAHSSRTAPFGRLQRKCACGGSGSLRGECAECKKKETLQRRAMSGAGASIVPPIVHEVLRSSGQPLDSATRAFFEPRFRHDFSKVRVHIDSKAVDSARAVDARAYTVGRQIVFGAAMFRPDTSSGRQLLAHELMHVVQQNGEAEANGPLHVGPTVGPYEDEAGRAGSVAGRAETSRYAETLSGMLQRQSIRTPAPVPGVSAPSPPPPGPASSRIDVRDTAVSAVPRLLQGYINHIFIVYHDGSTGKEYAWRGGNTAGKSVCPGVGLPKPTSFLSAVGHGVCPFNDPSLGAIGVGPLRAPFDPIFIDWPAINSRTLVQGAAADAVGTGTCFATEAARISAACIPYSPCGPNSNSVAYTLLKNCGISPTGPPGLASYPGWGTLL
jgi:hypothetical protein